MSSHYFGVCPGCGKHDGYVNRGKEHWAVCVPHRVKWFIGANLFSSWKEETPEQQRLTLARIGFDDFAEIEPRRGLVSQ